MAFGDKLRQIRVGKGLSQTDLAENIPDISQRYISEVERNLYIPTKDKLAKIGTALDLTEEETEDLLLEARIEELGISDPALTMMFKDVRRMTHEEKRSIVRAYEAVLRARESKSRK